MCANEAYASTRIVRAQADSAFVRCILLGPNTETWQDAINNTCMHARCSARHANKFRSFRQWAEFADEVEDSAHEILWTEVIGGSSADAARAYYQNLQVDNFVHIMKYFEGPGKVILVN